jgi:hypothetical protein
VSLGQWRRQIAGCKDHSDGRGKAGPLSSTKTSILPWQSTRTTRTGSRALLAIVNLLFMLACDNPRWFPGREVVPYVHVYALVHANGKARWTGPLIPLIVDDLI